MRIFFLFSLSCSVIFSSAQTNVGIGTLSPTNPLHIISIPEGNPLRIEGVVGGAATDSILTLNPQGVVRKRTVASVLGGSTGWLLTGNAPVNTGASFLGTTNASSLFFRTNNLRSGFIDFDSTRRNNSFGNRALGVVTTGIANNAFGYQALRSLSTGSNNIAIGDSAAFSLTNGVDNILIGSDAGLLLGAGFQNVGIGNRSLAASVAASDNVAIGARTLENNIASANIAIGSQALNKSNTGSDNIAIGSNALSQLVNASNINIAIGNNSLLSASASTEQIAIGFNAGAGITGGSANTILGHYTLGSLSNNSSVNNTMVGFQAGGYLNSAGLSNNTMVGSQAGGPQVGGNNNTYIGYQAGPTLANSYTNSSALGNGAVVTANNMVRLGNTSTTVIGGSVGYSVFSDERVKTNVQEDVKGLEFISLLRPVTYNYNLQKMDDMLHVKQAARTSYAEKQNIRYSGFLAQEVEAAATQTDYNFSGVNKPRNEQSLYSINYAEIVVPLVKAVQELKNMVEKQQQEIEKLKAEVRGQKAENKN